jgi:hypothetical protein
MVQVTPSAGSCALAVSGESLATRVPITRTRIDLRIDGKLLSASGKRRLTKFPLLRNRKVPNWRYTTAAQAL